MKYISMLILCGFICAVYAQAPTFFSPETLKSGGVPIDVSYYGAPVAYDWDGDGVKDIVTGRFYGGQVWFYKNVGTHNNPVFSGYDTLRADGSYISAYAS
jgi:hypothetical protein